MRRRYWLVVLVFLTACGGGAPGFTAATQTREGEFDHLTRVAAQAPPATTPTLLAPTTGMGASPSTALSTSPMSPRLVPNATTVQPPPSATRRATPIPQASSPSPTRPASTPSATSAPTVTTQLGLAQVTTIPLVANDIAYDPRTKLLYISVPGRVGPHGNSIIPIDPFTGTIGRPAFIGSEPTELALSDDGQFLYVGLYGAGAIRRYRVAEQQPDLGFSLGFGERAGAYYPGDLAIVPGDPHTVVVARRAAGGGGLVAYTDDRRLPREIDDQQAHEPLVFCGTGSTVYSSGGGGIFAVDNTGLAAAGTRTTPNSAFGSPQRLRCDDGRVYFPNGAVFDTRTNSYLSAFPDLERGELVCPDSSADRVYFVQEIRGRRIALTMFKRSTLSLLAQFDLGGVGDRTSNMPSGHLVRWGEDGLAFILGDAITLIRSPLISGQATPATAVVTTPTSPPFPQTPVPPPVPTATPPSQAKRISILPIELNDFIYNPRTGRVYGSVPGDVGANGNSILIIDPASDAVVKRVPIGSEPNRLALSADGLYLYVGLDGTGAVRRFNTLTEQAEEQFSLGTNQLGFQFRAANIAVMPDNPHLVAVARVGHNMLSTAIYDRGVKLPQESSERSSNFSVIAFCGAPGILCGLGDSLYRFRVDAAGLTLIDATPNLRSTAGFVFEGLIYTAWGQVLDPVTNIFLGRYPVTHHGEFSIAPDQERVFALTEDEEGRPLIAIFDQRHFTQLATIPLSHLEAYFHRSSQPIRWGDDGLAYLGEHGELVIIRSPLIASSP